MFYPIPKKIQLAPSLAKWTLASSRSVLVLVGLHQIKTLSDVKNTILMENLTKICNKAKALDIPIVDLYGDDLVQGMQQLGEYAGQQPQFIFAGLVNPMLKQILPYLQSVTEQICVVNDAILLPNQEQHIHWIEQIAVQGFHHMNTYTLNRLWSLSAPSDYMLSPKGIMLAIAEQLNIDALELDPERSLQDYGLDSVGAVSLVATWRAHGANIQYEDISADVSIAQLLQCLRVK